MWSVEVTLAFDFFPANAVRFIPVQLSQAGVPGMETNLGDSLHFPPPTLSVQSAQPREVPDSLARRDELDLGEVAKDGEVSQSQGPSVGPRRPPNTRLSCKDRAVEGHRGPCQLEPVVRWHLNLGRYFAPGLLAFISTKISSNGLAPVFSGRCLPAGVHIVVPPLVGASWVFPSGRVNLV